MHKGTHHGLGNAKWKWTCNPKKKKVKPIKIFHYIWQKNVKYYENPFLIKNVQIMT
jgi:hypothetical protein